MTFSPMNHFNFLNTAAQSTKEVETTETLVKEQSEQVNTVTEAKVEDCTKSVMDSATTIATVTEETTDLTEQVVEQANDTLLSDNSTEAVQEPAATVTITTANKAELIAPLNELQSLFGDLSKKADEADKAKEKSKGKKATPKKSTGADLGTTDAMALNRDTIIRYYRDLIPVTNYFSDEELEEGIRIEGKDGTFSFKKIDGEELRKRLEKDYPEFVPGHTQMTYYGGERNFVIPTTIAKKKGLNTVNKVKEGETSLIGVLPSFLFSKKMPIYLLKQFIDLAKVFGELNLEVRGEIYFNFDTNEFLLHIPKQRVHELWVDNAEKNGAFIEHMLLEHNQYVQLACQIHSHHTFSCTPSATDNANERQPNAIYMIVGQTDREIPSVFARTFIDGQGHKELRIQDLFTADEHENSDFYQTRPLNVSSELFEIITGA